MSKIKKIIKKILGYKNINYMRFIRNTYRNEKKYYNNFSFFKIITKSKVISDYGRLFKTTELDNEYKTFLCPFINKFSRSFIYTGFLSYKICYSLHSLLHKDQKSQLLCYQAQGRNQ